jgi:branched-chain amino acid aminotransferase
MMPIQVDPIMRGELAGARLAHDKEYSKGAAFINGRYCAICEAVIPVFDAGFVSCDVTYEKVTVSKGRFFRLQDHFDRFARSCKGFRLHNPHSNEEMERIFSRLLRLTGFKEAGIFWCVTRGLISQPSDRLNPEAAGSRFYAVADPFASIATEEQRQRGLDLWISKQYLRIQPKAVDPTVKNFHLMDLKLSLFEARDHGKDWSVVTDADGYLTEAAGANIFLVKNGELYTPDSGCLMGITRKAVLELAEIIGLRAHVRKVHAKELVEADDAFLTSTAGGVMPVNSVDGTVLGGAQGPGDVAVRFHNLYWEKVWDGWKGTPVDYKGTECR